MPVRDFTLNAMAAALLGSGAFTVHLHTGNPGTAGTANEVTAADYAAKSATWTVAANGDASNTAAVDFGISSSSWGTVTYYSVRKGANVLWYNTINPSRNITSGTPVSIPLGEIVLDMQSLA